MVDERPVTGSADGAAPALQGAAGGGPAAKEKEKKKKKKKKPREHWPALLVRWPRLRRNPPEGEPWKGDWPVVEPADLKDYRLLAPDLTVWHKQVEPRFRRLDHRAQILQNQFWRQRVTLIGGGLLATSLATVQAAMGGGKVYLAVPQAGLTGLLAGLTVLVRSRRAQYGYLSARLKAERIKSEFFLFLTQAAPYADGDRVARFLQEVDNIETAESIA